LGVKEVMSTTNITRVNVRRNARNARSGVKNGVKRVTRRGVKTGVKRVTDVETKGMGIVPLMTIKDMAIRITMVTARAR
jgi:hypothetical protein